MLLKLPESILTNKNACEINPAFVPYPIEIYGGTSTKTLRTLKSVLEEVQGLLRRYAVVYPESINRVEADGVYEEYKCLVLDENTGVTRAILEKLGYALEESDHAAFNLYWIKLHTKVPVKVRGMS